MNLSRNIAKASGSSWWPALGIALIGALFCGVTISYVRSERYFYFWDNFAYNRATLESLATLQQPGSSWLSYLRATMQTGFSQLFTVVTAPMMAWLGESRAVFITSIVGFYLLPCALLGTFIVNRVIPLLCWQWPVVFLATGSLPVLWRASLTGYPDIGGIALAMVALLLISRDCGYRRWSTAVGVGVILAGTFLFRRHLIYCIIALMAATTVIALAQALLLRGPRRWSLVLSTILRLAVTTGITVAIIWAIAPSYFRELIGTNFRELYLPFQVSIAEAWQVHRDYIGVFYCCLGLAGLTWGLFHAGAQRWVCALLLLYVVFSLCIWVFYLRYLSVQYNLHFAVVIGIGLGVLTGLLHRQFKRWIPSVALSALLAVLWLDRLSCVRIVPGALEVMLPARLAPLRNPDYDEIKRLLDFLRANAAAPANHILLASSSGVINSDMLTVGEGNLYGRNQRQLVVMNGSHADTVQPYSLRDMLAADWIVVANPFQHHLRAEDQGVVLSIHDAMLKPTAFAADFQRVSTGFNLTNNVSLTLFRRTEPTPYLTQVKAARDMFDTVGIKDAWSGPFLIGQAATGAEYFDARLIVPAAAGKYTANLEQVRLQPAQKELVIFVRIENPLLAVITGRVDGFNVHGIGLTAEFFPDNGASTAAASTQHVNVVHGGTFKLAVPPQGRGVVALRLEPREIPPSGSPLGLLISNLAVEPE